MAGRTRILLRQNKRQHGEHSASGEHVPREFLR
jgi:hypothetical protein